MSTPRLYDPRILSDERCEARLESVITYEALYVTDRATCMRGFMTTFVT